MPVGYFHNAFSVPSSELTTPHFELTGMPLQMTVGLKKWNHYMLIYICAKFHACRQIYAIKSLTAQSIRSYSIEDKVEGRWA